MLKWGRELSQRSLVRVCPHRGLSSASGSPMPRFADLMRAVYKRSHPDLLRAKYPDVADRNEEGLQVINGILSTIKAYNGYPPQLIKRIPIALLPQGDSKELIQCSLEIKTGGGECKKSLTTSFSDLFNQAGLLQADAPQDKGTSMGQKKKKRKGKKAGNVAPPFLWNDEYFPEAPTADNE